MACTPARSDVKNTFNVQVTPCDAIMFEKLDTENQNYNKYTNSVGAPPSLNSLQFDFPFKVVCLDVPEAVVINATGT